MKSFVVLKVYISLLMARLILDMRSIVNEILESDKVEPFIVEDLNAVTKREAKLYIESLRRYMATF